MTNKETEYANGFADGYKARDREIVRCKDCKHGYTDSIKGFIVAYCCGRHHNRGISDYWFCADGERREN